MISAATASVSPTASQAKAFDLVIVGGGIVGLTVACFFRNQDLSVAIVERETQSQAAAKQQAYALHQSSQRIFAGLRIWSTLETHLQGFNQVKLSDADYPIQVDYQAKLLQTDQIGYVGQHQDLLQILQGSLCQAPNITYLCPYTVQSLSYTEQAALICLQAPDQETLLIETPLVIAADGSQSPLRSQAQIPQQGWAYDQSCVVATLEFAQPQAPIAYERFWPTGPLGVLPLSNHRYRIVWTLPAERAQQVLQMTDAEFIQALQPHLDAAMGNFRILGSRFQFPTKLRQSQTYIKPRLALVGDAAHTCHPVGGQGLNLGIRDAAALASVVLQAHRRQEDMGSLRVLNRYQRWRLWQNWLTLGFTDILNRLFSNQAWGLVQFRRLLLQLLSRVSLFQYLSLRFMAGLWG